MVTTLTGISLVAAWAGVTQSEPTRDADVIVVGAGIAGISAALEGAHLGGTILVVDMASVFGGHAVMSEGGLSIVGSPLQRSLRIEDTPDLAYADLDHQWNYPWGLLDPRYPGMSRGLSARNPASIWVNVEGRRFVNETASPKIWYRHLSHSSRPLTGQSSMSTRSRSLDFGQRLGRFQNDRTAHLQ